MYNNKNLVELNEKINKVLAEGYEKMTIVKMTDFGAVATWQGRVTACNLTSYAQYDTALRITFYPKRAKLGRVIYVYGHEFAIFKGWCESGYKVGNMWTACDKEIFYKTVDQMQGEKIGEESERIHLPEIEGRGKVYHVISMRKIDIYETEVDFLKQYEEKGRVNNTYCRHELQGAPRIKGLCGPMYDGMDREGRSIIRYETSEVNDYMSI